VIDAPRPPWAPTLGTARPRVMSSDYSRLVTPRAALTTPDRLVLRFRHWAADVKNQTGERERARAARSPLARRRRRRRDRSGRNSTHITTAASSGRSLAGVPCASTLGAVRTSPTPPGSRCHQAAPRPRPSATSPKKSTCASIESRPAPIDTAEKWVPPASRQRCA
jgi:hypothetical protein